MNERQLSCTIKPPVTLTIDSKSTNSGCKIIDVIFPTEIGEVRFKNYYVAFITLKAKVKMTQQNTQEKSTDLSWRVAINNFRLMPDAHTETGAQDSFSFTKKQFQCDMNNVISLRIILHQPSPQWKEFKVEDLKLFRPSSGTQLSSLPACLLENVTDKSEKKEMHGVPDLNALSSGLQQLWALGEEAAASQTQQSMGRYDVDGCYDINLLSYT
ncbi:unnamed protein product [Candidula unifasciata]|uniref:Nicolin-1 n=1 Tax=Candidula unifasciata TaxID=100452 RepID=A0A8S3ZGS6_9EUPU|nr:unnamed protein product [Candidula unifasciata]